jgi:hypothetical protein
MTVDYIASARRHLMDAHILLAEQRQANAGQLLGFSVECGLKALLLACGIVPDADGGIPATKKKSDSFREHMPMLNSKILSVGHLIPDGQRSSHYYAMLSNINALADWSTDYRYYKESAMPFTSVSNWELAALEIDEMLDQAISDGVM